MKDETIRLLHELHSDLADPAGDGEALDADRGGGDLRERRLLTELSQLIRDGLFGDLGAAAGEAPADDEGVVGYAAAVPHEQRPRTGGWSPCQISRGGVRYRYQALGAGKYVLRLNAASEDQYLRRFELRLASRPEAWALAWDSLDEPDEEERSAGWSPVTAETDVDLSGAATTELATLTIHELG
jgi:hypothetical protein